MQPPSAQTMPSTSRIFTLWCATLSVCRFRSEVEKEFELHDWRVESVYLGHRIALPKEEIRCATMNSRANERRGQDFLSLCRVQPRMCLRKIPAHKSVIAPGGRLFRGRRQATPHNLLQPLQHRTDGSDAFSPIRSKLLRGRYSLHRLREVSLSRYARALRIGRIIIFTPPKNFFALFLVKLLQW